MPNDISPYNPIFYAQEALIQLEKALGLAGRIHRGYDVERRSFGRGETIQIRKPGTFVVADAPASAVDLAPESTTITLDNWREVKFKLTDKELTFTTEQIIDEHIRPAAYAIADDMEIKLATLYNNVGPHHAIQNTGSVDITDITDVYQVLFDNKVPLFDPGAIHYMISGRLQSAFQALPAFSQQQGAGDVGVQTQLRGTLGTKFGAEIFATQNVQSHTGGTASDLTMAIDGTFAKGAKTINLDAAAAGTETLVPGDTLTIAVGEPASFAVAW